MKSSKEQIFDNLQQLVNTQRGIVNTLEETQLLTGEELLRFNDIIREYIKESLLKEWISEDQSAELLQQLADMEDRLSD